MIFVLIPILVFACTHWVSADERTLALGERRYATCKACHGVDGSGRPAGDIETAPSLTESPLVGANPEVLAVILLRGIEPEATSVYPMSGKMPLGVNLRDRDLAALMTFVRTKFGNVQGEIVTAEQVADWRSVHADSPKVTRTELQALAGVDSVGD